MELPEVPPPPEEDAIAETDAQEEAPTSAASRPVPKPRNPAPSAAPAPTTGVPDGIPVRVVVVFRLGQYGRRGTPHTVCHVDTASAYCSYTSSR